jgi:hypothetical protein
MDALGLQAAATVREVFVCSSASRCVYELVGLAPFDSCGSAFSDSCVSECVSTVCGLGAVYSAGSKSLPQLLCCAVNMLLAWSLLGTGHPNNPYITVKPQLFEPGRCTDRWYQQVVCTH